MEDYADSCNQASYSLTVIALLIFKEQNIDSYLWYICFFKSYSSVRGLRHALLCSFGLQWLAYGCRLLRHQFYLEAYDKIFLVSYPHTCKQ